MSLHEIIHHHYGDLMWTISTLEAQLEEAQKRIKELEDKHATPTDPPSQ
jgi:hypothetical protein